MPCYCDTPEEEEQIEIERRCKERMYFDSKSLLSREQLQECARRAVNQFPIGDVNDQLCKLCQVLTKEQMEKISAFYFNIEWDHKTLYDWYMKHIEDDKKI